MISMNNQNHKERKLSADKFLPVIFILTSGTLLLLKAYFSYANQLFYALSISITIVYLIYLLFFRTTDYFSGSKRLFSKWTLTIKLWQTVIVVQLIAGVVIVVSYYAFGFSEAVVNISAVIRSIIFSLTNTFLFGLFCVLLVLFLAAVGRKIFSIYQIRFNSTLEEIVLDAALGLAVFVYLSYFLAIFGLMYYSLALWLLILAIFFSRKELLNYLKIFYKQKFIFRIPTKDSEYYQIINFLFFVFLIFISSIIFVMSLRAFAGHADDLSTYYRVPELINHYHVLIPFYDSFTANQSGSFTAWYAFITLLSSPRLVFAQQFIYLAAVISASYIFVRTNFSRPAAIWAAWLTLLIGWHSAFISNQKVELAMVFYCLVSAHLLFSWINNKSKTIYLILSALFFGLIFTLKFNSLFLILPVTMLMLWFLLRRQISFKRLVSFGILVVIFLSPTILANFVLFRNPIFPYRSYFSNQSQEVVFNNQRLTLQDFFIKSDLMSTRTNEVTIITRENYLTDNSFLNFWWGFFRVSVRDTGFDHIGPVLLSVIFFVLFFYFKDKWWLQPKYNYLLFILVVGFILWLKLGQQRVWYSAPVFYLSYVFVGLTLARLTEFRSLRRYLIIFILSLSLIFFSELLPRLQKHNLKLLIGEVSAQTVYNLNPWNEVAQAINKEIISGRADRILMVPEQRGAFILESDKHLITDSYAAFWSQIVKEGKDYEGVNKILKQQGITHIFYSNAMEEWLRFRADQEQLQNMDLFNDLLYFKRFRKNYLKVIYCTKMSNLGCLYSVK